MTYDISQYDRPSVAADIVVFTARKSSRESYRHLSAPELSVLLIKRKEPPFMGMLSLPGGFCCREETIEETAERKLKEKTGLSDLPLSLLCNLSRFGRDPRGWIISCCYWTIAEYSDMVTDENASWYKVRIQENENHYLLILTDDYGNEYRSEVMMNSQNELYNQYEKAYIPKTSLAFDHAEIIVRAFLSLKNSLDQPYAAFRFLPEGFTLTQLQQIYEMILEKKLLMANFRRKILPYVEETDEIERGAGHRPSRLYRKKAIQSEFIL
ncbi:MAG: NUDIX hydrolase [Ruminococcus sp.]|nr:NUDIX hydrolase [Ruminococcus sp.]